MIQKKDSILDFKSQMILWTQIDFNPNFLTLIFTSSNLLQINVNALKIDSVFPVTVTILSGQLPSLMLILAPLCKRVKIE